MCTKKTYASTHPFDFRFFPPLAASVSVPHGMGGMASMLTYLATSNDSSSEDGISLRNTASCPAASDTVASIACTPRFWR